MINVTMLCANRPRLLKQALDSIGDLSDAHVAIRDAGINPEVLGICTEWCKGKDNTYLTTTYDSIGTGEARNRVIQMSRTCSPMNDYLYLSDDDVYFLRPDWLKVLTLAYEEMKKEGYAVVGAYNHPFNRPVTVCAQGHECYAVATQSMLMSWDVWDKFGPFCKTPAGKVCQSEDVDFCNRIRAAGYKVGVVSPHLLVNTGITNSFGEKIPGWEMVKNQCPEGVICE